MRGRRGDGTEERGEEGVKRWTVRGSGAKGRRLEGGERGEKAKGEEEGMQRKERRVN